MKLSQKKLGELLGVKAPIISNIENDKYNVGKSLGSRIDSLIYGAKKQNKEMNIACNSGNTYSFDNDKFIITYQENLGEYTKTSIINIPYNDQDPVHMLLKNIYQISNE